MFSYSTSCETCGTSKTDIPITKEIVIRPNESTTCSKPKCKLVGYDFFEFTGCEYTITILFEVPFNGQKKWIYHDTKDDVITVNQILKISAGDITVQGIIIQVKPYVT